MLCTRGLIELKPVAFNTDCPNPVDGASGEWQRVDDDERTPRQIAEIAVRLSTTLPCEHRGFYSHVSIQPGGRWKWVNNLRLDAQSVPTREYIQPT